eukprot:1212727-Pleurochrysis_carterae.AAC.2
MTTLAAYCVSVSMEMKGINNSYLHGWRCLCSIKHYMISTKYFQAISVCHGTPLSRRPPLVRRAEGGAWGMTLGAAQLLDMPLFTRASDA